MPPRSPRSAVALTVLMLLIPACGVDGDDDGEAVRKTTTTTASTSTTTSLSTTSSSTTDTTAPATTGSTAPSPPSTSSTSTTATTLPLPPTAPDGETIAGKPTSEQAAKTLYDAWQANDVSAAAEVADTDAIRSLFDRDATALQFLGCFEDGDVSGCQFSSSQNQLTFRVVTDEGRYWVAEIVTAAD